ncbi:acylneuraminate cytidylyltransferase [Humibacter albus]|uniref:acylneuraminate cytidylyltransferase n=1 Tax=Humibacter albus TaxID=427754 RepID=UPI0005261A17|nr:acylneuraminate cytidylyltransferase [Humibacter albus]
MSNALGPVVAVIPARAGSVGVAGKNLREVGGVTLVGRAIACARATSSIDHVVVSTDGIELASVAEQAGAEIVTRPAALSTGTASSESAVLHALDALAERGVEPSIVVFMQATSPFTRPVDIDAAVDRVRSGESDSIFAAVETHTFIWRLDADGCAQGINHDPAFRPMRQDLEPQYQETGAFYVLNAAGFRRSGHRFFGRVGVAVVPNAIDIDTEDDLRLADAIARLSETATMSSSPRGGITANPSTLGLSESAQDLVDDTTEHEEGRIVRLASVEAVVTDFDGVHTNDTLQVDQNGVESVTVNRRDGLGVRLLREAGIRVLILSTEQNPVVGARGAKLRVEVLQGVDDKGAALTHWAAENGFRLGRVAYLGNDINDLGALRAVGWPFAVADAHPLAMAAARHVLSSRGGAGAVRELAELILEQKANS